MPRTVTMRIDDDAYRALSSRAKVEKRSLSNYIELAALEYSKQASFVDDIEMDEILTNRHLVKRLREGSRQAKRMTGRFVD